MQMHLSLENWAEDEIRALLAAAHAGQDGALDAVCRLFYAELKILARSHRRRWVGNSPLLTTELVHEAFLKLVPRGSGATDHWTSRRHFFGVASLAMRQVLINSAEKSLRIKRGGTTPHVSLDSIDHLVSHCAEDLLELNRALEQLRTLDPRRAAIVEARVFLGLSVQETAAQLGISGATVKRDWNVARTWLYRSLNGIPAEPAGETSAASRSLDGARAHT